MATKKKRQQRVKKSNHAMSCKGIGCHPNWKQNIKDKKTNKLVKSNGGWR